jgi:hypothetical protein
MCPYQPGGHVAEQNRATFNPECSPKCDFLYLQITEEDERTSSRNSLDRDYMQKLQKTLAKLDPDTISIVESEDGVATIKIGGGAQEVYKQVIEVKEDPTADQVTEGTKGTDGIEGTEEENEKEKEKEKEGSYQDSLDGDEDKSNHQKISNSLLDDKTLGIKDEVSRN